MNPRKGSVIAVLCGALALSGCTATSADGSGTPTPATMSPSGTAEPTPPSPSGEPAPAASDAAVAPAEGAYVDYVDGVIEATPGPKVLFFHASWCPQCRALDEDLRVTGAPDGLTVFKVDYDARTDLRQRYGVTLQTTVVFVDDSGELISSAVLYDDPSVASLVAAIP